jgi:hypothetical protein
VDDLGRGERAAVVEVAPVATRAVDVRQRAVKLSRRSSRSASTSQYDAGERHPLALALDHQARGDGLHAARGQPGIDLAPQHRRHLVAVEPVEDAAGLLRVDEVECRGRGCCAARWIASLVISWKTIRLTGTLGLSTSQQVPGDGLALAVLIGGEQQLVGVLEQPA